MSSLLQRTASALANVGEVKLNYDYERIPEADRQAVMSAALEIKPRLKRAAADVYAVGEQLNAAKGRIPYGQWSNWLQEEFELTDRTARNFMAVADKFAGRSEIISDLPPTALYLLAAPSTPDEAVEAVVSKAQAGQKVSVAEVKKAVAEAKPNQADREALAWLWLRNYIDDKGRTWQNLEDNQVYHANSPCYQAFLRAHPQDNPAQGKRLLQTALDRLRKQHAPQPAEVRPLTQTETEAVIVRWLERHYMAAHDGRKLELVLGCAIHNFVGVIQAGRSLEPGTLQAAKMAIAEQLRRRVEAPRAQTDVESVRIVDGTLGTNAAADMIRSIIAAGGKHPEVDDYAAGRWFGAIKSEYGRAPAIDVVRQALVIVVRERSKAAPAPAADEIAAISDRYARAAPQQRRNVREAVQDALLSLNGVKADASALGIGSLDTAIIILQNIFDQVEE